MKETLKVLGLAAGIYGSVYAAGEVVHHANCDREGIHSAFGDDHMSADWHTEQAQREKEWERNRVEYASRSAENRQVIADINRTMDEITFKIGQIHGIISVLDAQSKKDAE